MEVIILAGGFGMRLGSLTKNIPKPMLQINGKPFLEWQMNFLAKQGITHFILAVAYLREQITTYFQDSFLGIPISYMIESAPLGTGGALFHSLAAVRGENFFLCNGDTYQAVDLAAISRFHSSVSSDCTIVTQKSPKNNRYGGIAFEENFRIFRCLPSDAEEKLPFISTGTFLFTKKSLTNLFGTFLPDRAFSLEKDVFSEMLRQGKKIFSFAEEEPFIDIGSPEDFVRAQKIFV